MKTEELRDKIDEMLSSDDYQYGMRSQNIDAILALLKAEYDRGREEGYSRAYDDIQHVR